MVDAVVQQDKVVAAEPVVVDPVVGSTDAPALPIFTVTYRELSMDIQAVDEIAARAMFNDRVQRWPSPREVTVTRH